MTPDRRPITLADGTVVRPWFPYGYGPFPCMGCNGILVLDEDGTCYNLGSTTLSLKAEQYGSRPPRDFCVDGARYNFYVFVCTRCKRVHISVHRLSTVVPPTAD